MFRLMKNHAGGELLFTAPEAVVTRKEDLVTATVVNASVSEEKNVDVSACGVCVEAKLYSSDKILPPSYFGETDVLAAVQSGSFIMPPHSVLMLRFR